MLRKLVCLFCFTFLASFAIQPAARAATLNVGPGQPYATIQSAIKAAAPGDTVLVSPGTYYENIDFLGKAITVTSAAGPATTIIDGGGTAPTVTFKTKELRDSVISGFTIRNGAATANPPFAEGGGIYVSDAAPTISKNIVTANISHAIQVEFGAALIEDNELSNTIGTGQSFFDGSGVILAGNSTLPGFTYSLLLRNTIENNRHAHSYDAGGVGLWAVEGTVIQNNIIRNNATTGTGGGIASFNTDSMTIVGNLIYGNQAAKDGGMNLEPPDGTVGPFVGIVGSNTIFGNTQTDTTGGLSDVPPAQVNLSGNLGVFLLVNNIIIGNGPGSYAVTCGVIYHYLAVTPLVFDHNDIYNPGGPAYGGACADNTGVYGNISADPLFTAPAAGNFQLLPGSPAIDTGNNSAPAFTSLDLAGASRIQDATGKAYSVVDMGALERSALQDGVATTLTLTPSEYLYPPPTVPIPTFYQPPPVSFKITLSSAAGVPTGPVTIFQDASVIATVIVGSSGTATLNTPNLTPGLHAFVATYPGQGPFQPAVSVKFYLYVPLLGTALTLHSSPDPSLQGSPVTFTLTASSADGSVLTPLTLSDSAAPGAVLATLTPDASGTATFTTSSLTIGAHYVTATYAGDSTHYGVTAEVLQTVLAGYATTAHLTCTPTSIPIGGTATLAASITSTTGTPTGSLSFTDNGAPLTTLSLSSGIATLPYAGLAAGTHTLLATYVPTGSFAASSASCTETVIGLPTTASLTVTPAAAIYGSPVTLTASVVSSPAAPAPPTGTVTFLNGASLLGTAPLSAGTASLLASTLPVGTAPLTCTYSGDATYAASSCNVVPVIISAAASALALTASSNPAFALTPVTFTAHLTSGGQALASTPVNLAVTSPGSAPTTIALVTDSAGTAAYTTSSLVPGSYTVVASFAGSNTRLPSSASLLETITVNPTANSLTSSPNPSYQGQAVTITAAVSSTPGVPLSGSVVFFDGATTLATVPLASGHATFTTSGLSAGTHALTASYSGTASLLASTSASVFQVVNPSDFSLATDPPALSLRTGHHTTFTLTASSVGIFADQLQLSSASLPLHVTLVPKPMAPLAAGGQSSASVYLDTDDVIGYLSSSWAPRSTLREILAGATLPALACLAFMPRRRLRLSSRILLLLTALLLSSTVACSGKYPASTAPGSYALQITATGSATGRTHTLNIPLTITE